jgi:hypothetical protein
MYKQQGGQGQQQTRDDHGGFAGFQRPPQGFERQMASAGQSGICKNAKLLSY